MNKFPVLTLKLFLVSSLVPLAIKQWESWETLEKAVLCGQHKAQIDRERASFRQNLLL